MYIFCVKTVKNWDPLFLELKRSWEMESSSRRGMASLFKKTGRSESTTCRKVPGPCKLAALKELNDKSFSKRMTNHQPSSSRTVLYKAAPDFHTQIPTPPKCTHTHTPFHNPCNPYTTCASVPPPCPPCVTSRPPLPAPGRRPTEWRVVRIGSATSLGFTEHHLEVLLVSKARLKGSS